MANGIFRIPTLKNEPALNYAPGSPERKALQKEIARLKSQEIEIPIIIGGEEVRTGIWGECRCPHNHKHLLGRYHKAGEKEVKQAIAAAQAAWSNWSVLPWEARAAIFLKAADLLAGSWRYTLNAATMLGQSKTVFQAEIDSACTLIDYWRFMPFYMKQIYEIQPDSASGTWNYLEWRPLEGFVFAVTPFNFVSIAGNLPTSPAMLGNTVLWKPASTGVYPAYHVMKLLEQAGLPPGVINFLPGAADQIGNPVFSNEWFAGLHFTGSTQVFQEMWKVVGANISRYRSYPRIVGETGGKDFIFAHASADLEALAVAAVRGAFEYQGQKCSAASRLYVPRSLWPELKRKLQDMVEHITMGEPEDFRNFMAAVIDHNAFEKIKGYIGYAQNSSETELLIGGRSDESIGYFIAPTVIVTTNPYFKTMQEEIFGPVLSAYIYPDQEFEKTLQLCDQTSPYALTGSIFSRDRIAIETAKKILRHAAGNFYINDKPTGAVIGQQPFGGGRASGTNDKAGSLMNLLRWCSPRTIKENFVPPENFIYPHMLDEE